MPTRTKERNIDLFNGKMRLFQRNCTLEIESKYEIRRGKVWLLSKKRKYNQSSVIEKSERVKPTTISELPKNMWWA